MRTPLDVMPGALRTLDVAQRELRIARRYRTIRFSRSPSLRLAALLAIAADACISGLRSQLRLATAARP